LPWFLCATGAPPISASCGLKLLDPDAKSRRSNLGLGVNMGTFVVEIGQTSACPEVYLGLGAGAGPELELPLNPNVFVPIEQWVYLCVEILASWRI